MDIKNLKFATKAIHAGQPPEKRTGALVTPIFQTSTYVHTSPGQHQGYSYSRVDNPTRSTYQDCVAALENANHALAFSSGMSAINAIIHLLQAGDHVICCDHTYGATFRLFNQVLSPFGIHFTRMNLSSPKNLESAILPTTKLLWLESPSNPLMHILDLKALCQIAKQKKILSVVDNTLMSPYFQKPLDLGADIVVHSATKYLNGHTDVIGGVLAVRDTELYKKLKFLQYTMGAIPSPMDCFLITRGIKTLHLRMQCQAKNALSIAQFLESHPKIEKVNYPGLQSHPHHKLAKTQMSGFGGMMSFFIHGGLLAAQNLLKRVQLFTLAESLGGVYSLIEHPATMSYTPVDPAYLKEQGITAHLIRISVGIEDEEDLKNDLQQALMD